MLRPHSDWSCGPIWEAYQNYLVADSLAGGGRRQQVAENLEREVNR